MWRQQALLRPSAGRLVLLLGYLWNVDLDLLLSPCYHGSLDSRRRAPPWHANPGGLIEGYMTRAKPRIRHLHNTAIRSMRFQVCIMLSGPLESCLVEHQASMWLALRIKSRPYETKESDISRHQNTG